jgi:MATE family multidrug resistance protein
VALSAVMTPLCLNSDIAIALLGLPEETAAKTSAYVSRVGLGFPALGIFMALRYHTQGLGITCALCVCERGGLHRLTCH